MAKTCRAKKIIRLHKSGMAACQSGDLDGAVLKLNSALHEVRKIGVACYQAKILNNLGIVLEMRGETLQARDHYEAALDMARQKLGDHADLSRVINQNLTRVA